MLSNILRPLGYVETFLGYSDRLVNCLGEGIDRMLLIFEIAVDRWAKRHGETG
jgi:hypothetical protein